jgi:hypothetical protein
MASAKKPGASAKNLSTTASHRKASTLTKKPAIQ